MNKPENKGITRIVAALKNSINGLISCYKNEEAFRQEVFLSLILIPLALFIDVTLVERLLLIISIFIVLITEIINSSIEALANRISTEKHELIRIAKDAGSSAVMLSILLLIVIWLSILLN